MAGLIRRGRPVIASRTSRVQFERALFGDGGGHHRRCGVRMAMKEKDT